MERLNTLDMQSNFFTTCKCLRMTSTRTQKSMDSPTGTRSLKQINVFHGIYTQFTVISSIESFYLALHANNSSELKGTKYWLAGTLTFSVPRINKDTKVEGK